MNSCDRALPLTLLLGVLACTVDSEDGATSLGDPSAGSTLPTTTASTTAASTTLGGSESSSGTPEQESSGAEASTTPDPSESSGPDPSGESSGGVDEQPADGMYSACESAIDCVGLQGCLAVMPTVGFCTNGSCVDVNTCDASPGGTATPACVAATLNAAATQVCALDCSGGKTCPGGMECLPLDAAMVCV
ncbi:MAG: hypothetical protein IAG13_33230 [Deltaproteobacteria bacterium]|nr:hypothetical protein [Nannocystaceae bacterium]